MFSRLLVAAAFSMALAGCATIAPHDASRETIASFHVKEIVVHFPPEARLNYTPAEQALAEKCADYFAAGTLVVWDVDVLSDDIVRVYRAEEPARPTIYRRGERAEAEPAVPRWSIAVDDLFPYYTGGE